MAAEISASNWKNVEVGRVVLLQEGPYAGRLATIVEIIDHKRVGCMESIARMEARNRKLTRRRI